MTTLKGLMLIGLVMQVLLINFSISAWFAGGLLYSFPVHPPSPSHSNVILYFAISLVLFIHSCGEWREFIGAFESLHLRRPSMQTGRMPWSKLLKMERAPKVYPLQEEVLLCLSP